MTVWSTVAPTSARATAEQSLECYSRDVGRRLAGCTKLLEMPGLAPQERASAYAMRALALSLLGRYAEAVSDYDRALTIDPNMPVALNNRAWAYYRSGNVAKAWPDVSRSLDLDPYSPHAYDTRAHLNQAEGNAQAALSDYKTAMRLGGAEMVKLYQCGLQAKGHYRGPLNGIVNDELLSGLKVCVSQNSCDPLPPDEACKVAMS
ncbi:MAG: tetratricopeptide repeat protein [Pseudomonadota bacterium]